MTSMSFEFARVPPFVATIAATICCGYLTVQWCFRNITVRSILEIEFCSFEKLVGHTCNNKI